MPRYQQVPLLSEDQEHSDFLPEIESKRALKSHRRNPPVLLASVAANVLLAILCAFLLFTKLGVPDQPQTQDEPYSPAKVAIEYEHRSFVNNSEFFGPPGPRWEHAIHTAMEGTLIRISKEELQLANMTSIQTKDHGFAAGLGVAHDLHCVKRLKQFLFFKHFYPEVEVGGDEYEELQFHADHCLDFIRQSLMCHIDYSLYTLDWEPGHFDEALLTHHAPQEKLCVNWNKLQQWMQSRSTSKEMLVGPGS